MSSDHLLSEAAEGSPSDYARKVARKGQLYENAFRDAEVMVAVLREYLHDEGYAEDEISTAVARLLPTFSGSREREQRRTSMADQSRYGTLPFPCPICHRLRVEYESTADGRLLVRCTKCGANHETICDAALAAPPAPKPERKDGNG